MSSKKTINFKQFSDYLQAGYNRIPVTREIAADLDTPLSVYLKLAQGAGGFILESVEQGSRWGRYSIIGIPAEERLEVRGQTITHQQKGESSEREVADPLAEIERFLAEVKAVQPDDLPPVAGGLFGYFGHNTVRYIEPRLRKNGFNPNPDTLNTPDILLLVCDELLVFDSLRHTLTLMVYGSAERDFDQANTRLDNIETALNSKPAVAPPTGVQTPLNEGDFISGFPREQFEAAVETARDYIHDGDIMQVVPSQRLTAPFSEHPLNLYRALRRLNPSPYMYFFDFGEFQVVGSSPEILVKLQEREITVRPIAGTRRRGHDEAEDQALEAELLADPKERAEHLMLIDLGRNDAGRVSETGSVKLTAKMAIERYSHVMHIVSNVTGTLKAGLNAIDALRATFPAGTLSGAPKIRALEIIDELEPVARGIYGGAVGYIGWNGNMDTAIAIRTAVLKDGQLHVQAGAGLVADSIPALEWKETMNKARAMMHAAALASEGL